MTKSLLDANVLIALTVTEHEHHERAVEWFAKLDRFASCPIVESALIRFMLRIGESSRTAQAVLAGVRASPQCEFWPDSLSFAEADLSTTLGHRHVTDTYLAALAGHHGARLATLDSALAARLPEWCDLVGS